MKKVFEYINSEWKYWLAAIVIVVGMSQPSLGEAKQVYRYQAGQFSFIQDEDYNAWYVKYGKTIMLLDQPFDDVKVIWHGKHNDTDIVLMAGQQGRMCEMNMRLYWSTPNGNIREDKDFKTCYARHVSAKIVGDVLVIKMDGVVKRVPL